MSFAVIIGLIFLVAVTGAIGSGTNAAALVATIIFFPAAIALYFAPTIIANRRDHENMVGIGVLNFFLGWTLLGWIGALVWAYSTKTEKEAAAVNAIAATVAPSEDRPCPFCAETIKRAAIRCRHCQSDVPAMAIEAVPKADVAPKVPGAKPLAAGDMACVKCQKHIPVDAFSCAYCGHHYQTAR